MHSGLTAGLAAGALRTSKAVLFRAQTLSAAEKAIAQANIGATTFDPTTYTGSLTAGTLAVGGVNVGRLITLSADVVLGGALTVAAGETVRLIGADSHVLTVTALAIAAGGVLDLGTHNLLIKGGGTASLAALQAHALAGRLVNNRSNTAYGLALCYNDPDNYQLDVWPNAAVSTVVLNWTGDGSGSLVTDTFVAYGLNGDANLDGVVNTNDIGLIDYGLTVTPKHWLTGDFNGNGLIDDGDYQLAYAGMSPTKEYVNFSPRGNPTVVANASVGNGLGAGGGASVARFDNAMLLTLTTGGAGVPVANDTLATISFSHEFGTFPVVLMMPANDAAWALTGLGAARVRQADVTHTGFTVRSGSTPFPTLTAATYLFNIIVQR